MSSDPSSGLNGTFGLLNHKYLHYGIITVTANFLAGVTSAECAIMVSGTHTVTLPLAATCVGRAFYVKELLGGGAVATIAAAGSDLIDGAATKTLTAQFQGALIVSDGVSSWWVLAAT